MENNWGGARQGAGRKELGDKKKVTLACRVSKQTKDIIYQQAEASGMSVGEVVELLINQKRGLTN